MREIKLLFLTAGVLVLIAAVVVSIAIAAAFLTPVMFIIGVYFLVRLLTTEHEDEPPK